MPPETPVTVTMQVNVTFRHTVSRPESHDAALRAVRGQVEMFLNKAKHEAGGCGIEMRCDYLVAR